MSFGDWIKGKAAWGLAGHAADHKAMAEPPDFPRIWDGYPIIWGQSAAAAAYQCTQQAAVREGRSGVSFYAASGQTAMYADFTFTSRKIASGSLGFLIYVPDMDGLTYLTIVPYVSDSGLSNFWKEYCTIYHPGWHWIPVSPPTHSCGWAWSASTGSPVFGTTDFAKIRFRVEWPTSGKRPTVEFFGCFENPRAALPTIAFTFDDGLASQYTLGYPVLNKYRLKGSFAIIADSIGGSGYMTLNQLKELVGAGHEMVVHGPINGAGSLLNYESSPTRYQDVLADVRFHRDFLLTNGLARKGSQKIYVFPQGETHFGGIGSANTEIIDALKELGFVAGRSVIMDHNDCIPHTLATDLWAIPCAGHSYSASDETANVTAIINRIKQAGATGKHLALVFHYVVSGTATTYQISQSNFDAIAAAAAEEIAAGRMVSGTLTDLVCALGNRRYV